MLPVAVAKQENLLKLSTIGEREKEKNDKMSLIILKKTIERRANFWASAEQVQAFCTSGRDVKMIANLEISLGVENAMKNNIIYGFRICFLLLPH